MKTGYVGIIGKPNAGKSTILNALIGEKLAIVTPKAQTTRRRIIGIYSTENCQIVFIDTPGYVDNPDRFSEKLVNQAKGTMREVDVNLLIVDATKYMKSLPDDVLVQIKYCQRPVFLIINKIDKIKKSFILPIIDFYRNIFEFVEIIPLSAKYKDGVAILLEKLLEYLPEGEPIYPEDQLSSQPQRMFVEEFIREAIFNNLSEEIPYSSYVQLNSFSEADT
nr:GTPase Era [Candidatus Delongbacteria bacterium]